MRLDVWLAVLAIPIGLTIAGCASTSASHDPGPRQTTIRADFRGSPPPLVALHDQADEILPGGWTAFSARLRALRGHPVVVNMWASWCGPCQSEFPVYQKVSARYGGRIAFLGIDENDTRGHAAAWLKRFPVTYPSYFDPDRSIVTHLLTITGTPQTFYFDARGREQYDHGGPYTSVASLERDIHTYLGVSSP